MTDVPQMRQDLENALARYRQAPESKLFAPLAAAYRAAGRAAEAVRVLRAGLERHPNYVSALVLLGECSLDLQEEESAEAAFARVLELDPENLAALRYRAERARRRGALERAAEILRRVLEIDPFDREVQADLGLLATAIERRLRDARPEPGAAPRYEPPPPRATEPAASHYEPPERALDPAAARYEPPPRAPEPPRYELPRVENFPPAPPDTGEHADESPPPPPIDLRRVGTSTPEIERWRWTRDEDRIVVSPAEPPVRGPIRSVEDRLWSEQQSSRNAPPPPPPAPPAPSRAVPEVVPEPEVPAPPELPARPAAPTSAAGEFATVTLARIYESQGYYEKALAIYDELLRRHPGDPEVAAALAALQRRLAGVPETPVAAVELEAVLPEPEEPPVEWRLFDATTVEPAGETAERLREVTEDVREQERARRHTVVGSPPARPQPASAPPAPPPPEDVSRGHLDFERFLAYVRSLQREE